MRLDVLNALCPHTPTPESKMSYRIKQQTHIIACQNTAFKWLELCTINASVRKNTCIALVFIQLWPRHQRCYKNKFDVCVICVLFIFIWESFCFCFEKTHQQKQRYSTSQEPLDMKTLLFKLRFGLELVLTWPSYRRW